MYLQGSRTENDTSVARSPAALVGTCNPQCAQTYWKRLSPTNSTVGPVCGVPGC